jgi:hypothetical protein
MCMGMHGRHVSDDPMCCSLAHTRTHSQRALTHAHAHTQTLRIVDWLFSRPGLNMCLDTALIDAVNGASGAHLFKVTRAP